MTPLTRLGSPLTLSFAGMDEPRINDIALGLGNLAILCADAHWIALYVEGAPHERDFKSLADIAAWKASRPGEVLLSRRNSREAFPQVARITKQSPLVVDLLFSSAPYATSGLAAAIVIGALKHPAAIGSWIPSVSEGWHEARSRALRARKDMLEAQRELRAAETADDEVRALETRPAQIPVRALHSAAQVEATAIDDGRPPFLEGLRDRCVEAQEASLELRRLGLTSVDGESLGEP